MKKVVSFYFGVLSLMLFTGCASIISGGNTEVSITSNSPDASVCIRNSVNRSVVYSGKAPLTIELKTSKAVFEPSSFILEVTDKQKNNKQQRVITANFNPWFIGNFILGGILGMGVDAVSGAVYKFDSEYYIHFEEYENN